MAERIIVTEKTTKLSIGYQTENDVKTFVFPTYEDFTATLNVKRPQDEAVYPIMLTQTEEGWAWTVTKDYVANEGWGEAQVIYADGEGAVKARRIYDIYVNRSLVADGEIPDPWESTYVELMERIAEVTADVGRAEDAAANAEQSAESASASATIAQQAANEAGLSAEAASLSSRSASNSATNAADSAELADGFAQVAQTAATEALTSATNASASASQAAASASAADVSRATAEAAATQAQASAEQAAQTAQSIEGALDDYSTTAEMTAAISAAETRAKSYTDEAVADIDLSDYMTKEQAWAMLPTDTASGAVASFPDGADGVPIESLTVTITPKQEGSGDPSPDNVRPISGWTAAGVTVCGKNLFDKNNYHSIFAYFSQGVIVANNTHTLIYMPCKEGVTYTAWRLRTSTNERFGMCFTADIPENGVTVLIGSTVANSGTVGEVVSRTLTAPEGAHYLCLWAWWSFSDITEAKNTLQIELGSTATAYEPYNGETITHEFKDAQGNTLTVYGGEDELVGGKLRVTHSYRLLTGAETWTYNENYSGFRLTLTDAAILGIPSDDLTSNMFKGARRRGVGDVRPPGLMLVYTGTSAVDGRYVFFTTDITMKEEWRAWLAENPVQLVYPLATPLEYDLDPVTVHTLLGDNTIYADCGDVSVTYKADVQKWVEKKLAE